MEEGKKEGGKEERQRDYNHAKQLCNKTLLI